jgi:hypothetical protein
MIQTRNNLEATGSTGKTEKPTTQSLPVRAAMQPTSAALLQLQTRRTVTTSFFLFPHSRPTLPRQNSPSKLPPPTHRRMRRNNTINILNTVTTQNVPQIQRLKTPSRNYHRASLNKQQREITISHPLCPDFVINSVTPKPPPLIFNIVDRNRNRWTRAFTH